jgi:hypothetical protein
MYVYVSLVADTDMNIILIIAKIELVFLQI